jgi:single-strand DNA-binding protein
MNKVFIIGRLTKDPEIRTTSTSKKVANFSIAVNEGKDANGQDKVQYFNLSAWDRLAEILESYVKKGTRVACIGSLQNRSWDKPDGTKGYATDISVREIEILSSRTESEAMADSMPSTPATGNDEGNSDTVAPAKKPTTEKKDDTLPEINVDDINIQMPF